jgi:hypothetical protein
VAYDDAAMGYADAIDASDSDSDGKAKMTKFFSDRAAGIKKEATEGDV